MRTLAVHTNTIILVHTQMQDNSKNKPKRSDERKGSTRKNIRFEDSLVDKIDADRNSQPFAEWVKDACHIKLKGKGE